MGVNVKKNTKIITILTLGVAAAGLSLATVNIANAANYGYGNGNKDAMVDELSSKLNVPKDKVQSAMDEIHAERQKQMQSERKANLDKAVTDGVITKDQENAIIAKQDEFHAQGKRQNREEMQKWMSDNGINETALHDYMGGAGRGFGR